MRFCVEPDIWSLFPGMRLAVVVADGLDIAREQPAIRAAWDEAWSQAGMAARVYGNAQSHPRVARWRERFQAMGVSSKKFPTSIEALLKRALKGGEPFQINPLVDWYNSISLRHAVPAGGFDLAGLETDLVLRLSREGDRFQALDEEEVPSPVPPGEVTYACGQTVLTRHFVWRQARTALITPATCGVFLVSEVLGEIGPSVAAAVRDDLEAGLRSYFGAEPQAWLMNEGMAEIEW